MLVVLGCVGSVRTAHGALSVLPERQSDTVVLTVYESGELGLVEDRRPVVLEEGLNRLRFSWENRRIDPSSLNLSFSGSSRAFHVKETSYPADGQNNVVWTVNAERRVRTTAVISYLFTGVSVEPNYNILLDQRSDTMRMLGRFELTNKTDDPLEPTRIRVLLGEVSLLDSIEKTIKQWQSSRTGSGEDRRMQPRPTESGASADAPRKSRAVMMASRERTGSTRRVTSDYHIMELEAPVVLPENSSTHVPFLSRGSVGYRAIYEAEVDGDDVSLRKNITVPNTRENRLGKTVLPTGSVNVKHRERRGAPSWKAVSRIDYTAKSDTASITVSDPGAVTVDRKLLDRTKQKFDFDSDRTLRGWMEVHRESLTVKNFRNKPLTIRVARVFGGSYWSLVEASHPYKQPRSSRITFRLHLEPGTEERITYTYKLPFGSLR